MSNLKEFQSRIKKQEELRIGDVYEECEKKGCTKRFLTAFDTRAFLYPVKQANAFLNAKKITSIDQERIANQIHQYRTFLSVLIEKRPEHENGKEWEKAMAILPND